MLGHLTALMTHRTIRQQLVTALAFLANFAAARGVAFAGPLILAYVLPAALYGEIEYALGLANVLIVVVGLGVVAGVSNVYLVLKQRCIEDLVAASVAASALISALCAGVALASGAPTSIVLTAGVVAGAALQGGALTYLRVTGRRLLSSWFDNGALHLVVLLALLAVAIAPSQPASALEAAVLVSAVAIGVGALVLAIRFKKPRLIVRARQANSIGLPMVGNGLVLAWLATSPRFYFGTFLSMEDLAEYAIAFRLAGVLLVIYQAFFTGLFPRLYIMRPRRYDRWASACLGIVVAAGVAVGVALPTILGHFYGQSLDAEARQGIVALFPLVAAQVFFWIAGGLLETRINRLRLAHRALRANLVLALAGLAVVAAAHHARVLDPLTLTLFIVVQTAAQPLIDLALLWRRRLPFVGLGAWVGAGCVMVLIVGGLAR